MHRFDDLSSAVAAVDSYSAAGRRAFVRGRCGDSPDTVLVYENGPKSWHRLDRRPYLARVGLLPVEVPT